MERTHRYSPRTRRIGGLLAALACAVALSGCNDDDNNPTPSTVGSLNVNVNPWSATVVVTGPSSFTQTFTGNQLLANLTPGQYTASATAPGFVSASTSINVVAGYTSSISISLQATGAISESPRAVYRDGDGNLVPIEPGSLQEGQFVFYAWLQDEPLGILASALNSTILGDPGKPLITEQWESAPSFTQNLGAAWVGFLDASGVVRPVIGADVRWEIDQWWFGRINSMQFGTSDDNRVALGYGVFDDQADTRTNNASLGGERFPFLVSEYPLYNNTGVGSPFADGFTWVTLFSPDPVAEGRIVAVATIDGEEIGKQILYKSFAPAPQIEITKTVDVALINLDDTDTVTWTVTVRNVGTGDATTVSLADFLASGAAGSYTLGPIPSGCDAVGDDGFNCDFPIPAATEPTPSVPYLLGNATSFAVLASDTATNTGSSVVSGDVGVSAGTAVTGFPPGIVLNGTIHNNDAAAQAAQVSLTAAYANLVARPPTQSTVDPSNLTLLPGVYPYAAALLITGPVVLDAQGDPNAEFVFQVGTALTTADGTSISLINGANPCNVYWQVGSSATLGINSFFVGNILASESITANTGATISGRALAQAAVTLDGNAVTAPLCSASVPGGGGTAVTLTFTASVTSPGVYCNEAQILAYSSETDTWTPVDLNDQDCFTAVESVLTIVKDFVADDNATSLGQFRTVAANVPAKLRVRVLNSGTAAATGVTVNDVLDGGALDEYELISVSAPGIPNTDDGFDTDIGDIAVGETVTLLFTVRASADGEYCDTAGVSDGGGFIDDDTACLTVASPVLQITKVDLPVSVYPSANYTSTIVVTNVGSAIAKDVVVRDLLGSLDSAGTVWVDYVSSSQGGAGGTLASHTVTAPDTVDLAPDESMTFTVVSRMPIGAVSGEYCDTATVTSSNAVTQEASDCVDVPAFSALQTQLVDRNDPIAVDDEVSYDSVLYVEELSNEGVGENVLTYSFGLTSPTGIGTPGVFEVFSTQVYLDSAPVRDPATGLVVSDPTSPTAVLQTLGTDYTLSPAQVGFQVITMTSGVVLQPNTALYVVHVAHVPTGTPANRLYTTSYIWDSVGLIGSVQRQASSSEPTTVLP